MDLSKILAVGGKPGLYKLVAQSRSGLVVEALKDGKRTPAFASQNISALDEISIYTESEETPLKEVFKNMYEKLQGENAPASKASNDEIVGFFEEILPEYDRDMVRIGDMKKVYRWYNELQEADLMTWDDEEDKAESEENTTEENTEE